LYFVRPNGQRIIESRIDLAAPHRLLLEYTQLMMGGLLYSHQQPPERCLLIGLGGGAMVHFLNRVFPGIALDVVELQPSIIELAHSAFGVRPGPGTRIMQGDGAEFVRGRRPYDVIFVDGFLHPGTPGTDSNGTPVDLKGRAFLADLIASLKQRRGVVVFNLNEGPETARDLVTLRNTFAHVRFLRHDGNIIAVALPDGTPAPTASQLASRARNLDRALPNDSTFAFRHLV
jgi:spermidine synthase